MLEEAALGLCAAAIALAALAPLRRERRARKAAKTAAAAARADARAAALKVEAESAALAAARARIAALEAESASARAEADAHRRVLDACPLALWRRGPDDDVVWANAEARRLKGLDAELDDRTLAGRARRLGGPHNESRTLVVEGARRVFDVTETQSAGGDAIGWAEDVTALFSAQEELDRQIDSLSDILGRLSCGVEIYGPDQRLRYFNPAFARMTRLDSRWLEGGPRLAAVLDAMRDASTVPQTGDYIGFRQQRLAMFQSLTEEEEEVLYLPDGAAWRMTVAPDALGGLIFLYEDATTALGLERDVNILIDVRRETMDHLIEALAVFGPDGRLKLHNPAFGSLWRLMPLTLAHHPHVRDVAADAAAGFADDIQPQFRDWLVDRVSDRRAETGAWTLQDDRTIDYRVTPLPDGAVMFAFLDVSDSVRLETELKDRANALLQADQLKSEFVAGLAREARAPADAVAGFADVLADETFGPLSTDQRRCAASIAEAASRLLNLLDDIDDLSSLEDHKLTLDRRPTPLDPLFDELAIAAGDRADRAGVAIVTEIVAETADQVIAVEGDPGRLRQALLYLLENAVRHTPTGGRVTLRAEPVEGDMLVSLSDFLWAPTAEPVFDVADGAPYLTGAVARGDALPLFEGLDAEAGAPEGEEEATALTTVLRLRLAARLIESHGGTIRAWRRAGGGGVVECRLPAAQFDDDAGLTVAATLTLQPEASADAGAAPPSRQSVSP